MNVTFGDGSEAFLCLSREVLEQQRACYHVARAVRAALPPGTLVNIEADISPQLTRFVIHFAERSPLESENMKTVEVDFHPGCPLEDKVWIDSIARYLVDTIRNNDSDLLIDSKLDYVRICDEDGKTLYQRGRAVGVVTRSKLAGTANNDESAEQR